LKGIEIPVKLDKKVFEQIEKQNPSISFNVMYYMSKEKYFDNKLNEEQIDKEFYKVNPYYVSKNQDIPMEKRIDILLLIKTNAQGEEIGKHYVWLKNLERLRGFNGHSYITCRNCFTPFKLIGTEREDQ